VKKAYLLAFSASLGTQEQVKAHIEKIPEIILWRYDMPHSFYLISEASAEILAKRLREATGEGNGRFIIAELSPNYYGWLTSESWYLIKHKEPKPKEKTE
jgi:hypothetical protein